MRTYNTIFEYITAEEANYQQPVDVLGWDWSMKDHIKTSFFYKHGRQLSGNDPNKPVKNITRPLLNLQYRTEDLDVKDIALYVEDPDRFYLSFLVKKYHDAVYIKKHNVDELLDGINESRIDYGGSLVKKGKMPELVPLETIAFCDQTDVLSGPIGIKHYFSPDQLKDMKGWGETSNGADITIDELITLATESKDGENSKKINTPGKYIEVYEVHGTLPGEFLDEKYRGEYIGQMQIVSYYNNKDNNKEFVTLFKAKEDKPVFKFGYRDKIHGRALGFGGVEELFENQVWTNYNMILMKDMLDAASKIIMQTDDKTFAARNNIKKMKNLEVAILDEGKKIGQVDTFPRNINLFEKSVIEWESHAAKTASANDPIMGEQPVSGTPFKLQELVTNEARGMHDYRKGKQAKFVEEIYRDWILNDIAKELTKDQKFLAELSFEEMQEIGEQIAENEANRLINEKILNGEAVDPQEVEMARQTARHGFMKSNKKFIEILKDDLKDVSLKIEINVANKQKDLYRQVDKLVNIFRQIASAPQLLDDPRMAKLFNQILESSGLSPLDFGALRLQPQQQAMQQPQQANTTPMKDMAEQQQTK